MPPRTRRPADDTIATRRCDSGGPVTHGSVAKLGQSYAARRCACAGGKSAKRTIGSSLLSAGLTLAIEKVLKPLARVAGGEPGGAGILLGVEAVAPAHPDLFVQQALDALHHARVVLGDRLSDFETRIQQACGWDDLVQQPDPLGLRSRCAGRASSSSAPHRHRRAR